MMSYSWYLPHIAKWREKFFAPDDAGPRFVQERFCYPFGSSLTNAGCTGPECTGLVA